MCNGPSCWPMVQPSWSLMARWPHSFDERARGMLEGACRKGAQLSAHISSLQTTFLQSTIPCFMVQSGGQQRLEGSWRVLEPTCSHACIHMNTLTQTTKCKSHGPQLRTDAIRSLNWQVGQSSCALKADPPHYISIHGVMACTKKYEANPLPHMRPALRPHEVKLAQLHGANHTRPTNMSNASWP